MSDHENEDWYQNEYVDKSDLRSEFRRDIISAINRNCAENLSGTPDHILANYLLDCLNAYDQAILARAKWRSESVELPALQRLVEEEVPNG